MSRASKAELTKDELDNLFADFTGLLSSFSHPKSIQQFLEEFLTKEEKIMLSKRLALYEMLYRELPLRDIQQTLGMSDESVRVYNDKKYEKSDWFREKIGAFGKKKGRAKLFENIAKKLKPLEYALNSKTNMKARAKLLSGDFEDR